MIEITLLQKTNGPLTKRIKLADDGRLLSDGSVCVMGTGTARRVRLNGLSDFASQIHNLAENQAIALGSLDAALPDQVQVVTKWALDQKNGHAAPDMIARTGGYISYKSGEAALALLDYDSKGMPPSVADRVRQAGGFWPAVVSVLPDLATAAHVSRSSTSAGLFRTDTGAAIPGSDGQHVFVAVRDGGDLERFLRTLHDRAWLAGLGWLMVGRGGQLLERSIVDRMVFAPERLVFEGPPRVKPPLQQDPNGRVPIVTDGDVVDTASICRDLTAVEQATLKQLRAVEAHRLKGSAAAARMRFVAEQAESLAKRPGVSSTAAVRIAHRQCEGVLLPPVVLPFDSDEFAGATVGDVLANPHMFVGATLADPLEGPSYGACKAKVMRRGDGSIWIHSFAHGRTIYDLNYDATPIEAALRDADRGDVVDLLARQIVHADLTAQDEANLKELAGKLSGVKPRPLNAQIKAAREQQRKQRAEEERQQRAATRTDGRIELPVPHPDDERTAVLRMLDEVLTAIGGPEPPMRNAEGWPVEIRCRPPSKLHELTSAGANQDEIETSRLPAPDQPLITAHDRYSLAHEIERHVRFTVEDKDGDPRSVALPPVFVDHFMFWRDSAMPRVEAILTAPMVLADGRLLMPDGLDRDRRLFFRIEPALREMMPAAVTKQDAANALDFLVNGWLCDVAMNFKGRCVLISAALSIIERALLPERPVYFVTAGRRGGGKTTAVKLICLAVTGKTPPAAAWSDNSEERRKSILGYLSEGLPCLIWDNLSQGATVACTTIDKVSTAETYSDRVLKQTDNRTVPAYTIMLFTGNNVVPAGDTASRALMTRLDVDRPDPENRSFTHADPVAWTLDHRGEILRALYTILLYNPQLKPGPAWEQRKTRFKLWWHLVGSAVEHAAEALVDIQADDTKPALKAERIDFGKIFAEIEADDEVAGGIGDILYIFHENLPGDTFRASDVEKYIRAESYDGYSELSDNCKTLCRFFDPSGRRGTSISPVTIGKALQAIVDAPVFVGDQIMKLVRVKPVDNASTAKKDAADRQKDTAKRPVDYRVVVKGRDA